MNGYRFVSDSDRKYGLQSPISGLTFSLIWMPKAIAFCQYLVSVFPLFRDHRLYNFGCHPNLFSCLINPKAGLTFLLILNIAQVFYLILALKVLAFGSFWSFFPFTDQIHSFLFSFGDILCLGSNTSQVLGWLETKL